MTRGHTHDERKDCPDQSQTPAAGASANRIDIKIDANALSIIALMLAVAAIVIVISQAITGPRIVDARIQAGAAAADATAREARTTAKMTEDKLVELRDHLNSKGMNIPKLDGH